MRKTVNGGDAREIIVPKKEFATVFVNWGAKPVFGYININTLPGKAALWISLNMSKENAY